jgi:methylmalonyl-CoA/ethylmalonyl-CoA epimerase
MKFDHIGITTLDLTTGRALLADSIHIRAWTKTFADPVNDVCVQFGRCPSGVCYELVAPLSDHSPVRRVLTKKINVLNHLAYLVGGLGSESARLQASGWVPIAPARPAVAYGGCPIQFLVSSSRLMIELIEAPDHHHDFLPIPACQRQYHPKCDP